MPELPEVEVTRLSFCDAIAGARIESVRMGLPLRWPLGIDPAALAGRTVQGVQRRGKYLLLGLDRGLLLVHLGMSGRLDFGTQLAPAGRHDHFEMHTVAGVLRLNDPRRFGAVVYAESVDAPMAQRLLGRLGVEPLSDAFEAHRFHQALRRRHTPIKQVLLAGDVVVGVGNIYASEVLFLAGIRPTVRASRLSAPQVRKLHAAIGQVLSRAIQRGGSTLRNFADAQGHSGHFQLDAAVYGRAGQPCLVCSQPVKMLRQGQRSTFYCSHCQKP